MKELLEESGTNVDEILRHIMNISQFHRIQGSKEIVDAAKYILEELKKAGIDAQLLKDVYDGETWHLTLKSPIGWDLIYGEIEIFGKKFITEEIPLVVMAHSPSGEAEGEIVYIEREDDWEKAEGKIVLVGKKWKDNYKKANKSSAIGFVAYRKGTGKAFPYMGLFLSRKDLEWAKIPAVAVSEEIANKIISKLKKGESVKTKIRVQTEIGDKQILPMVYAKIGKPPYILFTAHICHPKPGANDNASGSAMLIELAKALKEKHSEDFRFGFAFLWIPEYHGTQAFIEKFAELENYYAVINLDMVGGSEDRSNSTIMIVRTPLSRFSIVSGLLEYYLNLANSQGESFGGEGMPKLKVKSYSYQMGSDHDIFNFFGVPGVMPITWPDKFYHSSEDSIEKISKDSLEVIGKAVLATALALAKAEKEKLQRFARGYAMKYLGELGMDREIEVAEKLVMKGLARDGKFLGIDIGHDFEFKAWIKWKRKGLVSVRTIREFDEKAAKELEEFMEDKKFSIHLHELLMLGEILPEEEAFKALEEEFGKIDREKLNKALEILKKLGFIEC
ncbi:DUF4910 domain-containing protein [Thermococcus barophilus]|uniref:Peptidase M28 domain-containing protein n=1 Tax=Thermococcus barophilus TaxID=55802 RepID=A0A0S1XD80_THEBA|nr:DUF4910 domain-containing protein [Thermococcus barophilus]ALM75732.1 hypothetical protein TBCH5v1_1822 [Thermococcus barophilus]